MHATIKAASTPSLPRKKFMRFDSFSSSSSSSAAAAAAAASTRKESSSEEIMLNTSINPISLPPGFRFHPTDEELILHYLRRRASSSPCPVPIIADVDIYKFDPWDLPAKARYGDGEWYFYSPRERKYPNGFRPNRAAASGYWKATGGEKPIVQEEKKRKKKAEKETMMDVRIGVRKALVFYKGRPPKGVKTNWIMHEYRLVDDAHPSKNSSSSSAPKLSQSSSSMRLDDWVLCRIYRKNNVSSLIKDQHHQQQQKSSPPPTNNTQINEDHSSVFPNLQFQQSPSSSSLMPQASISTRQNINFHGGSSTSLMETDPILPSGGGDEDNSVLKQKGMMQEYCLLLQQTTDNYDSERQNYSPNINLPDFWEQELDTNILLDQQHFFM